MLVETPQPHVKARRPGNAEEVPERGARVRFVFVNGRTPRGNTRCTLCCEEIRDRYVREISTGLIYCDCHYGAGHSTISESGSRSRPRVVS